MKAIVFTSAAARQWAKLSVDIRSRIDGRLKEFAASGKGDFRRLKGRAGSRLRICFASPTKQQIREGVAILAEVCRKEFGVPTRSANVERRA